MSVKTYILDSSVLVHDPNAMFVFEENRLLFCTDTLKKLSEIGSKVQGERGANARTALRKLQSVFNEPGDYQRLTDDYISVFCVKHDNAEFLLVNAVVENMFSGSGLDVADSTDELPQLIALAKSFDATIVSKDVYIRLFTKAANVPAEDYKHDRIDNDENFYTGRSILYLSGDMVSALASGSAIAFSDWRSSHTLYSWDERTHQEVPRPDTYEPSCNEFFIVKNASNPSSGGVLARLNSNREIVKLDFYGKRPFGVEPRNVGQHFAIEALMQPASVAPLVILKGQAGTAKTFLSMACGLEQAYNNHDYKSILVSRQSSLLDESPGYLPGDEVEKVSPLLRSVFDNINVLMPNAERTKNGQPAVEPSESLMMDGALKVQAMTFMRGRSIEQTYVVIDEAQNCTPQQLFTLVTRVSSGTKIVILGDINQIDNPYLDRYSNGLTFLSERMRGSSLCWQVTFQDNECERSALATEAIHRLAQS